MVNLSGPNDLKTYLALRHRGLSLGIVPEMAAKKDSSTPVTLDHDLDALPGVPRRLTVGELAEHVDELAARLSAAGVRPQERVALYKAPNFDVSMLAMATSRVGAVPVLLSPALDGATVGTLLDRLDRPHLVADEGKLDVLSGVPVADLTKLVITVAGHRPGAVSLADFAGAPRVRPVFHGSDEPEMITHTSGTTGVPKLVVHTPRRIRIRLRPQWVLLSLLRKRENVAIAVPFVHSRIYAAIALSLLRSMPVLFARDTDPDKIADAFLEHRPGIIEALPNAFLDWERLVDDPREPLASVKCFSSTFDAIHPRTISRLLGASRRRAPLYFQLYGQSEVGPTVGRPYFRRSAHRADGRCVGFHLPGTAWVRVVSRNGKRPSKTNPGFIEVRWRGLAKSYFGEPERFAANLNGGWWRTGDVGYRTWAGCIHLLDREVDMISGVDSSLEVEDLVLSRLGELNELVVVPGPNSEPIPVICTDDDRPVDPARWRAAVADFPQLAEPIQMPKDSIPRTATLKVRRLELSARLRDSKG